MMYIVHLVLDGGFASLGPTHHLGLLPAISDVDCCWSELSGAIKKLFQSGSVYGHRLNLAAKVINSVLETI